MLKSECSLCYNEKSIKIENYFLNTDLKFYKEKGVTNEIN